MRTIKPFILILITVFLLSCEKEDLKNINGLWLVEKVEVGENTMTPVARWTRFNKDGTQTSGNGWLQHSVGSWFLKDKLLTVKNTNGINDEYEPFSIEIEKDKMIWTREEEGQEVSVFLKRIDEIPASEGNKLIGLWKLTKVLEDGNDITVVANPDGKSMLHLRWGNVYVQHNMPKGRQYGIYKIHDHKPEIQLVNYGESSRFSFWNFSIDDQKLKLISRDQKSEMEFERIHQFIQ
ncbi:hypothetical protein AAON49_01310 [Pseudotenacibaculum sp. MALMAid0570]|uniref:hypothetical protein n=1 Tax=Pseudotenacibaculum sp. MALMAid0570 TaxID=3143938 RepID=UPI0032DFB325